MVGPRPLGGLSAPPHWKEGVCRGIWQEQKGKELRLEEASYPCNDISRGCPVPSGASALFHSGPPAQKRVCIGV